MTKNISSLHSPAKPFKKKRIVGGVLGNLLLIFYSLTCIYPAFWLLISAMKTKSEFTRNPVALPKTIFLDNFRDVFAKSQIVTWLGNSFRNTFLSLLFILCIGFVVGYLIARVNFKARKLVYAYFLIGMLIPVHALMIPLYLVFSKTQITDRWYTLLLPYIVFSLPLTIFLVESFIQSIPRDIEEAAAIDGSSFSRTLFFIILPICKPILVTSAILSAFANWNEFVFALILVTDKSLVTIPVGLTLFKGQFSTNYPVMMASMFVGLLFPTVLYFVFSGKIIQGTVVGAVKG